MKEGRCVTYWMKAVAMMTPDPKYFANLNNEQESEYMSAPHLSSFVEHKHTQRTPLDTIAVA